jgi:hypothetical protein
LCAHRCRHFYRNTTLGILWGSLENLTVYGLYISDKHKDGPRMHRHRENLLRYVRLVLRLTFAAARGTGGVDNLDELKLQGLFENDEEYKYLAQAAVNTRPDMALMWLWRVFDEMRADGVHITDEGRWWVQSNIESARSGIQTTLGMIECPFPYSLAHIMHWIVQVYIWILAVDTGVGFAIQVNRMGNGA